MKDPYDDELGKLLNELDGPDLNEINNAIFKDGDLRGETNQAKRLELSEKIKSSYRHSLNLIASEHEPEWRKIVIATIDKLGIKLNKDEIDSLTILELEGKIVEKLIEKILEKNPEIVDKLREEFIGDLSHSVATEFILKEYIQESILTILRLILHGPEPIGIMLEALSIIGKISDTNWKKVIIAVMVIGMWRLKVESAKKQKEGQEQEKNLLNS